MSTLISLNIKSLLMEILVLNAIASAILVIISKNPVISVVFLISLVLNSALYLIVKGISFLGIAYILIYLGAIIVLFLFVIMMINIKLTDILETGIQYTKNIPLALIISGLFLYECLNILPYYLNNAAIPLDWSLIVNTFKEIIIEINHIMIPSTSPIENIIEVSRLNLQESNTPSPIGTSLLPYYPSPLGPLGEGGPKGGREITNALLVSSNWPEILVVNYNHIVSVAYGLYTYGALEFLICGIILLLAMIAPIYISKRS